MCNGNADKEKKKKTWKEPAKKKRAWVNAFLCLQRGRILVNSNLYQSYETSKLHCIKREIFFFPSWSCVWNVCCAKEATPLLLTNQITWLASMLENTIWFSLFSASLNRMLSSQSLPFSPNADRALYFLYLSLTRSGVLQAIFLPCPYHSILHPSYQYGETVLILFTIHITFQWWK